MKSPQEIVLACRKLADRIVGQDPLYIPNENGSRRGKVVILRKAADDIARIFEIDAQESTEKRLRDSNI